MNDSDVLSRLIFEHAGVRGCLVHLDASWQAIQANQDDPPVVRDNLGEVLAATALLASTIKFEGALILQLQGDGPLRSLVAQATHARTLRGLARYHGAQSDDNSANCGHATDQVDLAKLLGENARLVLTIQRSGKEPYQGLVDLSANRVSAAIENYFARSEQLPTRLWLAADEARAAGLLLQTLPDTGSSSEDWNRIGLLAATLTNKELLELPTRRLLHRLFHEETLRVFEPEPWSFRCSCSRQRVERTVKLLDANEIAHIIEEAGSIAVTCEFCNREYRFDPVDARQLLAEHTHFAAPNTQQ